MQKPLILAATALLAAALFAPAFAQTPAATPETTIDAATASHYRIANFAADLPAVDVWVDGQEAQIAGLKVGTISDWQNVVAGAHQFAVGAAGSESTNALIQPQSVSLGEKAWTTIAIIGAQSDKSLKLDSFTQNMGKLNPGVSRVTFMNAVSGGPQVNILRDGVPFMTSLAFPGEQTVDMDGAQHTFEADTGGQKPAKLASVQVGIEEATYPLIALIGTSSSSQLVALVTDGADIEMADGTLKAPGTLIQAISGSTLTGDLAAAIDKAGLTDLLSGKGPYTVFVPNGFKMDPKMDAQALATLLKGDIVEGAYGSQALTKATTLNTLAGTTLTVHVQGNSLFVNNAQVIDVNIPATNGVIDVVGKPPAGS